MRIAFGCAVLAVSTGIAAEKPRIYVTESQTVHVSGEAQAADAKGFLNASGGSTPENVTVMKAFQEKCPGVTVTANKDKADFVIRFDHEAPGPTILFTHGNKVAVFDKNEDLVFSDSTRLLANGVKNACKAILARSAAPIPSSRSPK